MLSVGRIRLLPLLVILPHFVVSTVAQLPSEDILTLLEFKKSIKQDPTGYIVDSWNEESIDFNGCPSSWNGIVCSGGNVVAVVLDNLNLIADADLRVFGSLTMLVKLTMANNSISGVFPDNVADFKSLDYMELSNNLFSGSLPQDIDKLVNIQNLSLAGNNFSGSLPAAIGGLRSIKTLDLSRNSFLGSLPVSLTSLDSLVSLNLSCNAFSGKIPAGIEGLASLEILDLHQNLLEGVVDGKFLRLTKAVHVDLSGNLLMTSRSQEMKFLFTISETIEHLNLSRNQLNGSLVSGGGIASLGGLKVLDLSYNQLNGELPGFDFVYSLQVLKLGNNQFSGFVPNGLLKDSLVLTELDLGSNNLSGPVSLITSTTLRIINLSSNAISGELPLLTGACAVLDLSNNQLSGNLSALEKWRNDIEYLDLSRNLLAGSLPPSSLQFLRLNYLNLSHNLIVDSLPALRSQFPKIQILDLSSNQFVGSVSDDFLTSPSLQEAYLQSNSLSGNIMSNPPMPNKSNLEVLDISGNKFNGTLPDDIGSFSNMQKLYISRNGFSGSLPRTLTRLISLVSLDFSFNNFSGPLPEELPNSMQAFNASYNDLSGVVPLNLRKFPDSSFHPGNAKLQFPNPPSGFDNSVSGKASRKTKKFVIITIVVSCVAAAVTFILLVVCICCIMRQRKSLQSDHVISRDSPGNLPHPTDQKSRDSAGSLVISAEDLMPSRKGSSPEIISGEKLAAAGFFPSKTGRSSWSPESSESFTQEQLARLDVRSPDRLAGELYFLDETIRITPEELSRAPAEVLGRSSHGTSYKATLENGMLLTVKWLREGVAKPRKEFTKEAKKFANIRHPNVVGLRGYYWGPTQHEKLILSDYISPGSLASFLYDRPGRRGPPLTWVLRLKIAVDVARGLNYLHFDRAIPHGNIKATNILLDGPELNARVADYCLHRLMTQAGTIEQVLDAGILGYRAPELAGSRKPSPSFKSDIYAFGVVLLELLTGRCAGDVVSGEEGGMAFTDWLRMRVAEGRGFDCFDAVLMAETTAQTASKSMKNVLGIALRCLLPVSERPGIKSVYEDLSSI